MDERFNLVVKLVQLTFFETNFNLQVFIENLSYNHQDVCHWILATMFDTKLLEDKKVASQMVQFLQDAVLVSESSFLLTT